MEGNEVNRDVWDLGRDISMILSTMRRHLERSSLAIRSDSPSARSTSTAVSLMIEEVRLSTAMFRFPHRDSQKDSGSMIAILQQGLSSLVQDKQFRAIAVLTPYRSDAPRTIRPDIADRFPIVLSKEVSLLDVAEELLEAVNRFLPSNLENEGSSETRRLRQLLPAQKIAPVKFDFKAGRLIVVNQPAKTDPEDKANANAAREQLVQNGQRLLDELARSNCDKRLIETVERLHTQLETAQNIIQLGILNIGCDMMCGQYEAELPDALAAMLHAQTVGVSLYVAQFPEWHKFVEHAAELELTSSDIERIARTAKELVRELQLNTDVVDIEVPLTIARLSEFLANPRGASKRAAFAVLRTIENLVSRIFSYGAEFIDQTVKKTIESMSTNASKVVVIGLLTLAVSGASGLAPIASRVPDMSWIRNAVELVQKQIAKLGE